MFLQLLTNKLSLEVVVVQSVCRWKQLSLKAGGPLLINKNQNVLAKKEGKGSFKLRSEQAMRDLYLLEDQLWAKEQADAKG